MVLDREIACLGMLAFDDRTVSVDETDDDSHHLIVIEMTKSVKARWSIGLIIRDVVSFLDLAYPPLIHHRDADGIQTSLNLALEPDESTELGKVIPILDRYQ